MNLWACVYTGVSSGDVRVLPPHHQSSERLLSPCFSHSTIANLLHLYAADDTEIIL